MAKRILVAAALIAGTLATIPVAPVARSQTPPPFRIDFPLEGEVINNGAGITTFFRPAFDDRPGPRDRVSFTFDYLGDNLGPVKIKGPGLMDLGNGTILWDTSRLKGGQYGLQARLVQPDGDVFKSPVRRVIVNEEPFALASARLISGDPIVMEFDAQARDRDGQITTPQWKFGDGTTGEGMVVQHTYSGPGTYHLNVKVGDEMGGSFDSRHVLTITQNSRATATVEGGRVAHQRSTSFEIHKTTDCGCESIRVKTSGEVEPAGFGYSKAHTPDAHPAERTRLGSYNAGSDSNQLPADVQHPYVICKFEVIAKLIPGSAPEKCEEGVRFQATFKMDGRKTFVWRRHVSSDPRYDSSKSADDPYTNSDVEHRKELDECNIGSGMWCDGGFHGGGDAYGEGERGTGPPDEEKLHGDESIYMLLLAGFPKFQSEQKSFEMAARYHIIIGPDSAKCECFVDVLVSVDYESGRVLSNEVTDMSCNPPG